MIVYSLILESFPSKLEPEHFPIPNRKIPIIGANRKFLLYVMHSVSSRQKFFSISKQFSITVWRGRKCPLETLTETQD